MRLKLFKKYFLTTSSIIILSLAIMLVILSFVMNNYIAKSRQDILNTACDEISDYVDLAVENSKTIEKSEFYNFLNALSNVSESDIFLSDNNNKIFICGCHEWKENNNCSHTAFKLSDEKIKEFLEKENELHISTLEVYEKPHYVFVQKLKDENGEHFATVFATAPLSTVGNLLYTITKLYCISAFIPLLLMFISIYVITYRLTKPLKLMSEAAKSMARGDFSKRIPVTSDDEIGELAVSFNMMTNSLSQLEGMRKSFVANVSHELKTPMTTIGGFIDGILDGTIEPAKQDYYLQIVSDEVKRLSRLVQSMLSMSRLESGEFALKPEVFDFGGLLCNIVVSQEQRIEKANLDIKGLDTLENISVNADRDLIHQVIYNLVDNAIKFTDENGEISFSLKNENKSLVFTITNTGAGIPQKDLPYIFERFYKVDKARSASKNNTGLGLYIAKTIISAHSGTISVYSRENEFTTFKIILPMQH